MSLQAGLSFDQAPPFTLPLRFFLTAPLFLLLAAGLIVAAPDALAARSTPRAFALTHALTLGFLAMTMLGALTQMLPVVAGAKVPRPRLVAWLVHLPLVVGTLALMAGFLTAAPVAFGVAVGLLGFGLVVFLLAASVSLARAATSATVGGMRLAALGLALTVVLGGALALLRMGWWTLPGVPTLVAAHIAFGLLGWVLLLVIGVAYQVVPMFQMTPPYPPALRRWLGGVLFALLLLYAIAPTVLPLAASVAAIGVAGAITLFALTTLRLQAKRRRKLPDVTLAYWRVGMASLIACVAVWLGAHFTPGWRTSDAYPMLLGILFIAGFAVSVVSGMLYKIVPFLAWFHLQAQLQARAGGIPTMREMIGERWMRAQFYLHLLACSLLLVAAVRAEWTPAAGVVLAASALLLWLNLLAAVRRFWRHGGRFL